MNGIRDEFASRLEARRPREGCSPKHTFNKPTHIIYTAFLKDYYDYMRLVINRKGDEAPANAMVGVPGRPQARAKFHYKKNYALALTKKLIFTFPALIKTECDDPARAEAWSPSMSQRTKQETFKVGYRPALKVFFSLALWLCWSFS